MDIAKYYIQIPSLYKDNNFTDNKNNAVDKKKEN